jgi:hypothetical protein
MAWTFYNASGEALTNFGPVALTDLDIDGGTAIGEAVVGADLFIADNGAGGTNVKVTATEIATFIGADTDTRSGVAKCWGQNTAAGALNSPSYNVASVTDTGVGSRVYVWTTDFSSAVYSTLAAGNDDQFEAISIYADNQAAGSCTVKIRNSGTSSHQSGAFFDTINSIVAYGDQ